MKQESENREHCERVQFFDVIRTRTESWRPHYRKCAHRAENER